MKLCDCNHYTTALLSRGPSIKYVSKIFRKLTFLTPWYAHVRVRIRGLEMLVFRTILRMYIMDVPQTPYNLKSYQRLKGEDKMYHTDNLQTLIGSGVLYVVIMSRTRVRVNIHSIVAWMSRNSLLETGVISEIKVTATGFESTTT